MPIDADVHKPEVEYGDYESGRDGPMSSGEDDQVPATRRSQTHAKVDHFNCVATHCTDAIAQIAMAHASRRRLPIGADEHGPAFEYGDHELDSDAPVKVGHYNSGATPNTGTCYLIAASQASRRKLPIDADER